MSNFYLEIATRRIILSITPGDPIKTFLLVKVLSIGAELGSWVSRPTCVIEMSVYRVSQKKCAPPKNCSNFAIRQDL